MGRIDQVVDVSVDGAVAIQKHRPPDRIAWAAGIPSWHDSVIHSSGNYSSGRSVVSTRSQRIWPTAIWTCWMRGVSSEGARNTVSAASATAPPARAGERFGGHAEVSRGLQGPHHVGRATGGAQTQHQVRGTGKCLDFPGEDLLEIYIVGHGGEHRRGRGQRQGRKTAAIASEAVHQFTGQVLGIGLGAPVTQQQDLAPGLKAGRPLPGQEQDGFHLIAAPFPPERGNPAWSVEATNEVASPCGVRISMRSAPA